MGAAVFQKQEVTALRVRLRTAILRWFYPRTAVVLCVRDTTGAYHGLSVTVATRDDQIRVAVAVDGGSPMLLPPLQVGWLRRKLREELLAGEVAVERARQQRMAA